MEYNDRINAIKGIGEKTEKAFHRLGIETVQDLLEHYPRGYEVFEHPRVIAGLEEGVTASIEASITMTPKVKRVRNLQIINTQVKDASGSMHLTWFNMPFLQKSLRMGYRYIFRGKVIRKNGVLVMEQPGIYQKETYYKLLKVLQPIYPLTEGITNKLISKAMKEIHKNLEFAKDYIPKAVIKENALMDRTKALKEIHFPKDKETMARARHRLVFDEFFLYSLALRRLRDNKVINKSDFNLREREECEQLIEGLPFPLTKAQIRVWVEIKKDLAGEYVMNRLIQGDVGSGKTILAILTLLMAVKNGYQASLMVPTEVLAKQHEKSLRSMLEQFGVSICLLVGSMTAKEKREAYDRIKNHKADIIVGTHALIQEKVEYDNLALVITDEQHRFGVKQREALMSKGSKPHVLVMSATPIPRTLAIILYGDLDISIVDELPAKRLPIKNTVVDTNYRTSAYRFIDKQVAEGRQAYVICPMVEESEAIEAENVIEYTERLKEVLAAHVSVEYLHGKMKPKEKNEVMERFAKGDIHVLVSTTVVEVGVNVPNATVMMVENAERFGLAQLHQLRGRVGRGEHQSYCIFVCGSNSREARERLEILNKSNDGFFIAGEDLKLRGPGDMFGIRQSGAMEFKMGDVFNDAKVLKQASDAVKNLKNMEVNAIFEANPQLEDKILNRNTGTL
ncbi:ATP-dependent DNA helicase RecG [Mobilitalea sibirica]|uniref:ATP-dependent DNA helicase RecG n=1 Tax=Mobilitalea sibirica TaxID=1462919 RepID=A0A8J7HA87_9FIRM|nr:ATP-dependent DNA helicase RecG [Mobilitalea sibirica]MBH1939701.1 ATP-dependent DNA helicase RecG [Mobilitalea sibirica]